MVTVFGLMHTGTWEPSISVVFGFCCLRILLSYFSVVSCLVYLLIMWPYTLYDAVSEAGWLKQVLEHTMI